MMHPSMYCTEIYEINRRTCAIILLVGYVFIFIHHTVLYQYPHQWEGRLTYIGKSNSAFKRLNHIRWDKKLGLHIKLRIYNATVVAILSYSSETRALTKSNNTFWGCSSFSGQEEFSVSLERPGNKRGSQEEAPAKNIAAIIQSKSYQTVESCRKNGSGQISRESFPLEPSREVEMWKTTQKLERPNNNQLYSSRNFDSMIKKTHTHTLQAHKRHAHRHTHTNNKG